MNLKLYLNKYLKVDNIEYYTLSLLKILLEEYTKFLDKSEGIDPDFPEFNFNSKGKKVNVNSRFILEEDTKKTLNKLWHNSIRGKKE